jgi:hypothetical protein
VVQHHGNGHGVAVALSFDDAPRAAERFEVRSTGGLHGAGVRLNGRTLTTAHIDGALLQGQAAAMRERLQVPALSYTFWVLKEARASACVN